MQLGPLILLLGGTLQANLDAEKQAWPKVREFLQGALQPAVSEPGLPYRVRRTPKA